MIFDFLIVYYIVVYIITSAIFLNLQEFLNERRFDLYSMQNSVKCAMTYLSTKSIMYDN